MANQADIITQSKIPFRPVANYVVRLALHKQLKVELHSTLESRRSSSKTVVVCGLGGAGKTQLALHYVQHHRRDYAAVFWIEAGSKESLDRDYTQIWRLLYQSKEEKVNADHAVRGVNTWFRQHTDEKWLLVFDNADNLVDDNVGDHFDLNMLIPKAPCVDVIVTTRNQTVKEITSIPEIQVGDMNADESLELLLRCSKIASPTENEKKQAVQIVEELGRLALAVALAGSYIAATPRIRSHLENYLPEYRQRRKELLSRKAKRHVHQYGESVLTTWETSYAAVHAQRPEALGLLHLLAFLSADDIFHELFEPLLDKCSKNAFIWGSGVASRDDCDTITRSTLDNALEILSRYSLLFYTNEQNTYAIHKLVHHWSFDRMEHKQHISCGQQALMFIRNLLQQRAHGPVMKSRIMPHVMACFRRMQEWYKLVSPANEDALYLLEPLCGFLADSGHINQEVILCSYRYVGFKGIRSIDHEDVLLAEHDLASAYWRQGRWKETEDLDLDILRSHMRLLGEKHPKTLTSMANLASTYWSQGRFEEAEELEVKVLEVRTKALEKRDPETLTNMANLASTYGKQGRWEDAERLNMSVMEARRNSLGEEHPETLTSMNNLASILRRQGRWDEAEKMNMSVLMKRRDVLGEEHPETLTSMNNLAVTYWIQGRLSEAEGLWLKAVDVMKRVLGEEHPSTLTSTSNLAVTYSDRGMTQKAQDLMIKCAEAPSRVLGAEHLDTAESFSWPEHSGH